MFKASKSLTLVNCTFANNRALTGDGGGINSGGNGMDALAVTNCILWGNEDQDGIDESSQFTLSGQATFAFDHDGIQGWTGMFGDPTNDGNDPLFVDPANGDFTLQEASPSRNTGTDDPQGIPVPDTFDVDDDGDTSEAAPDVRRTIRIRGSSIDRGAHEFWCIGDVSGDGSVEFADVLAVLTSWGPCPLMGNCVADVTEDGVVDFADILFLLAHWGTCNPGASEPATLEAVITGMGLVYPDDGNLFQTWMTSGSPAEQDHCACWMDHYYDAHYLGACLCQPSCAGADPWGGTHVPY